MEIEKSWTKYHFCKVSYGPWFCVVPMVYAKMLEKLIRELLIDFLSIQSRLLAKWKMLPLQLW